jgi:hypothetical protein
MSTRRSPPKAALAFGVSLLSAVALPSGACADGSPHLGLAIPADCFLYFHARRGAAWDSWRTPLGKAWAALREAGVFERLLLPDAPAGGGTKPPEDTKDGDDGKDGADDGCDPAAGGEKPAEDAEGRRPEPEPIPWGKLLGDVDWSALLGREVAFGLRYQFPRIEAVALFRVEPGEREALVSQLVSLIEEVAARSRDLKLVDRRRGGIRNILVESSQTPEAQFCLGGVEDAIAISTSAPLLRRSLQLLAGESSGASVVLDEGAAAALAALPAGRDFQLLARPGLYFGEMRKVLEALKSPGESKRAPRQVEEAVRRLERFLATFDGLEWAGVAGELAAGGILLEGELRPRRGLDEHPLAPVFAAPALGALPSRLAGSGASWAALAGLDFAALEEAVRRAIDDGAIEDGAARQSLGPLVAALSRLRGEAAVLIPAGDGGGAALAARLRDESESTAALRRWMASLEALPLVEISPRGEERESASAWTIAFGAGALKTAPILVGVRQGTFYAASGEGGAAALADRVLKALAGDAAAEVRELPFPELPGDAIAAGDLSREALLGALRPLLALRHASAGSEPAKPERVENILEALSIGDRLRWRACRGSGTLRFRVGWSAPRADRAKAAKDF